MVAPIPRGETVEAVFASVSQLDDCQPSGLTDLLGALLASRPRWMGDALCAERPAVDFFPARGDDVRPAKQVCDECLVMAECREWAIAQGPDLDGIWSGTSNRQRRQMRAAVPKELRQRRPPRRQVATVAQQERKERPTAIMERASLFLAGRDEAEHQAVAHAVTGDEKAITRALLALSDEGYVTLTIGGIDSRGRHSPKKRLYRHVRPYAEDDDPSSPMAKELQRADLSCSADIIPPGGPATVATAPPGRSTAA